jgi:membrane-associated phospholipid phosphatase
LFHDYIVKLADNPENIWGSCPSFHNYWAALFILYGLKKDVKWYFRYPMLVFGIMISLSTLMLHQHNLADIIITYSFTFLFAYLIKKYDLVSKLKIENFTCFK